MDTNCISTDILQVVIKILCLHDNLICQYFCLLVILLLLIKTEFIVWIEEQVWCCLGAWLLKLAVVVIKYTFLFFLTEFTITILQLMKLAQLVSSSWAGQTLFVRRLLLHPTSSKPWFHQIKLWVLADRTVINNVIVIQNSLQLWSYTQQVLNDQLFIKCPSGHKIHYYFSRISKLF